MVIRAVEMGIFISYRLNIMETFRKLSLILVGKSQCECVCVCVGRMRGKGQGRKGNSFPNEIDYKVTIKRVESL